MPKLKDSTQKAKAKALTSLVLKNGMSQTKTAKKLGVTKQAVQSALQRKPYKDALAKLLDDNKFKKVLVQVGIDGLQAMKTISASILVNKDGKVIKAEEQGAIETADHKTRHKFWRDFLKATGYLTETGINIQFGSRDTNITAGKIIIVRSANAKPLKKVETVEVKKNE